jgi:putative hemolysin
MVAGGYNWLAGCCSVSVSSAAGIMQRVPLSPQEYRVTPRRPWRGDPSSAQTVLPPLLRGYVRLGAWVCGPPADDPDFGTADFFVLLSMANADPRYLRHFLGDQA